MRHWVAAGMWCLVTGILVARGALQSDVNTVGKCLVVAIVAGTLVTASAFAPQGELASIHDDFFLELGAGQQAPIGRDCGLARGSSRAWRVAHDHGFATVPRHGAFDWTRVLIACFDVVT